MAAAFLPNSKARVIQEWQVLYPDPIVLKAGEEVKLGQLDTEWPGWVWCVSEAGKGGWVPEKIIESHDERGRALADYTAAELAVGVGEELTLHNEESGWYWATNEAGQSGWVPASHVELMA